MAAIGVADWPRREPRARRTSGIAAAYLVAFAVAVGAGARPGHAAAPAATTPSAAIGTPTAGEPLTLTRLDEDTVELRRLDSTKVDVWSSLDARLDRTDHRVQRDFTGTTLRVAMPAATRGYLLLVPRGGKPRVVAERTLPLQQGSNFRDCGGYLTHDGRVVRWGKLFRSAAMPLLTERDYQLLAGLHPDSIVDLRALAERELMPDQLDDRTGALFLSNDYPLRELMAHMGPADGELIYKGLETLMVPQFRMMLARLLEGRGAVVVHDVWGQDRVGVVVALLYDVLGVDRATIHADFHLSEQVRRPQFEIPDLDPKDYPGNLIVGYYASKKVNGVHKPDHLYTPTGASHIDRFLDYVDRDYGGSEAYFRKVLGVSSHDLDRLRAILLD